MFVKDLIEELKQYDENAKVSFVIEDNFEENHSIIDKEKIWFNPIIENKIVNKKNATEVEVYLPLQNNVEIEYRKQN